MRVKVLVALTLLLAFRPAARAETYDIDFHAYCPIGSDLCGFSSYGAYWNYIHEVVQEINVQWEVTGISFRPAFVPVPLPTQDYIDAQCADISGTAVNEAALFDTWRQEVAAYRPGRISILLNPDTKGQGCCSQLPNNASYPWYQRFGILCDSWRDAYDQGSVLAHELGHHFCLCHTFQVAGASGTPIDLEEWDLFSDGALDWDGDESCPQGLLGPGTVVLDTDPDPREFEKYDSKLPVTAPDESSSSTVRNNHEWCTAQANLPVDQASTHGASCTTTCSRRIEFTTDPSWVPPGTAAERAALAMSYWDDWGRCHGPWTRAGLKYEAFTPNSVTRVRACRDTYRSSGTWNPLVEVCGSRGGDTDHDGICNFDDNCDLVKNTNQKDSDGDGQGDPCDLSFEDPTPQVDLDEDLIGALMDQDADGDGCSNGEDQHPYQAKPVTGSALYVGCDSGASPVQTWEGHDSDGDGLLNCEDLDDDDDGTCDEGGPYAFGAPGVPAGGCVAGTEGLDPCPVDPADGCHVEIPFPDCAPPWVVCNGSGCRDYFLKLVPVDDPGIDPLIFDSFQIVNRTLFVAPTAERTLSRVARALQGDFEALAVPETTGPAARATERVGALRLEIWWRGVSPNPVYPPNPIHPPDPGLVAVVAEYASDAAMIGDASRGRYLALTLEGGGLTGAAVWAAGQDPGGAAPRDADRDGWPDLFDNCIAEANPAQTDADGDGFGNACDADLDGDFAVTAQDLAGVEGCLGADLRVRAPISEPDWLDGGTRGVGDPAAYALAARCRAADVDDDGDVDGDDVARTDARLGAPPGPSAFRGNTSACAAPGACDDADPCTVDRCVHSTGECLHLREACDDLDRCTLDTCDRASGECGHVPVVCDDGNPCTADACNPADGTCVFDAAPLEGSSCDDGSACTARETCQDGLCAGIPAVVCDDGDPCTLDACDPATGGCIDAGDACDDGNPCTLDSCGPDGCEHVPAVDGAACDDGDACTADDTCIGGQCQASPLACDDGDACTVGFCDPLRGECYHVPLDCDDGDACTVDTCGLGACSSLPRILAPVTGLRFESKHRLAWDPSPGAYWWNTYRGTIPRAGLGSRRDPYDHACFESAGLGADGPTASTEFGMPAPGEGYYFLISPEDPCGEGPFASGPGVAPRPNDRACRTP